MNSLQRMCLINLISRTRVKVLVFFDYTERAQESLLMHSLRYLCRLFMIPYGEGNEITWRKPLTLHGHSVPGLCIRNQTQALAVTWERHTFAVFRSLGCDCSDVYYDNFTYITTCTSKLKRFVINDGIQP